MAVSTRQRWYWFKFQCQHCGADSKATRSDAKFCGARCRVAWNRAQAKAEAARPSPISNTAAELIKAMAKPPRSLGQNRYGTLSRP